MHTFKSREYYELGNVFDECEHLQFPATPATCSHSLFLLARTSTGLLFSQQDEVGMLQKNWMFTFALTGAAICYNDEPRGSERTSTARN